MKKNLLKLEKVVTPKKDPSAIGGYAKLLGHVVSGIAWGTSHIQLWGMQADVSIRPATSVKDQYKRTFANGEISTTEKIDEYRKALAKIDKKLAKATKPKKIADLTEERALLIDDISALLNLVKELRKKQNKA